MQTLVGNKPEGVDYLRVARTFRLVIDNPVWIVKVGMWWRNG